MATSKAQSLPSGILRLTKLLDHLNKPPKLTFTDNIKSLRLTLAISNDHWGARHFVKDDLPRIRHHNPDIQIDVTKWRKEKNEHWRPELELKFDDGHVKFVDMDAKKSSTILKEVMSIAGGLPWKTHVEESIKAGIPIVPARPHDNKPLGKKKDGRTLPNLREFWKANPNKAKTVEMARKEREGRKAQKKRGDARKRDTEETAHPSVSEVEPSTLEKTPSTPLVTSTTLAAKS